MNTNQAWSVVKFGGTSVSDHSCWSHINTILKHHLKNKQRVVLICSAPAGVSNLLEQLTEQAAEGTKYQTTLQQIHDIYHNLAIELTIDFDQCAGSLWQSLQRTAQGISLLNDNSAKSQAKILAFGELILTTLAAAYLNKQSFKVQWCDARHYLIARDDNNLHSRNHFLYAECDSDLRPEMIKQFNDFNVDIIISQGFIARDNQHETVLLGRGGSDVSAAYFSAHLAAVSCTIWTDVPGIYTANPHLLAEARHLAHHCHHGCISFTLIDPDHS